MAGRNWLTAGLILAGLIRPSLTLGQGLIVPSAGIASTDHFGQSALDSAVGVVQPTAWVTPNDLHSHSYGPQAGNRSLFAPYFWLPAMKGNITALGNTAQVDLSLDDVWDLLDDARGGFSGHAELMREDWGIILDGMILSLEPTESLPTGSLTAQVNMSILEILGVVPLADRQIGGRWLQVDFLAGARYYQIGLDLDLTLGPVRLNPEQSEDWVDLVTGTRLRWSFSDRMTALVRGDFGGFGIGTSSKLAWNVVGALEYGYSDTLSFLAGYRILDVDESKGSGVKAFHFDVKLQGPFIAASLAF